MKKRLSACMRQLECLSCVTKAKKKFNSNGSKSLSREGMLHLSGIRLRIKEKSLVKALRLFHACFKQRLLACKGTRDTRSAQLLSRKQ